MKTKPTYAELQKRVQELEKQISRFAEIEKLLKDEQDRFRLLYERAPLAYQSLDEQGRIIEVNHAWMDMLGYSREEVIGRSMGEFLSNEWKKHFKENFPRFKNLGEILGVEFEIRTKEGIPLLVSVNGKIGYDEEGNFLQTHCILYDITERDKTDKIRDQIVADLYGKIAREKEIVDSLRNSIINSLQEKMAKEKELVAVFSDCKLCSEKLKQ